MEGAAARTLLSNAGQLLSSEYQQLRGVGGEVAELRDELDAINALLIMQSEAEDGAVDRFLQVCMLQLREVAYDAEDCIDLYTLRIRSRPNDGVRAWLGRVIVTLPSRRRLACEIRALRARTLAISERQARFGVNRDALRRSPPLLPAVPVWAASSSTPASSADHRQLVGIEDQANALAAWLKASVGEEASAQRAIFSIVGFGGLGKTTLAMEVCRRLEAEFPRQAMVSVSQAFESSRDLKVLLKNLLQQVIKPKMANDRGIKEMGALGAIDALDDNNLLVEKKLEDLLADKRYLIVIDDVWTIRAWEAIQSKLPENNKGSRIIMTTRIETVANACSPGSVSGHCIHKMKPLKLEDSKKLFHSKVFGSADASYPEEFEDVMGNILKKCGGIPLAIVSIASVLVGYKSSKDKWDRVCKSIGSQMNQPTLERMKHIVTLSYNHLPHELKACMMYFSIFPEDYKISKYRLLNRWLAEGLVQRKRGMTMWEVAESYLEELSSRNMIEELGHANGHAWNEQTYRVHDMLLEVMVSKSLEANFVSLHGEQYKGMFYDKVRRLSIHGDIESVDEVPKRNVQGLRGEDNINMRHVRSLSMFDIQGHKLLKKIGNFILLRVLDLEECEGVTNKHVEYACNLYLLRFLSLRGTNVSKIPRQIGNLENLQTLDLDYTLLTELPETITKLEKLEYIRLSNKDDYWGIVWNLPQRINKVKALRVLRRVCLGNDIKVVQEVGELEQLQEVDLSIENKKTIDDEVLKELAQSISKMHSLQWLTIAQHGSSYDGENILMNFLHHLPTPPRLLRTLWITGGVANGLPKWIGTLAHLVSFTIVENTTHTDKDLFGVLCMLPNLKTLYGDWDCYRGDELVARTIYKFPVLRDLILGGYLPKVLRFEEGSMTTLEKLQLKFDFRSRHVEERSIVGIENLTNLKKVMLDCRGDNFHALLHTVLEQMKDENDRRSRSNKFDIVVKYW